MLGSVGKVEVKRARGAGGDDGGIRSGDFRVGGLSQIGDEYVFPQGNPRAGTQVLHVEDDIFKIFIEDPGLDLEGCLRELQTIFERKKRCGGARGKPERVEQAGSEREKRDEGDDLDEVECTHACGAHGRDFRVRGEAG